MALAPLTTGAGNEPSESGTCSDSVRPWSFITASGPAPPPDKVRSVAESAGENVLPERRTSVASRGFHAPEEYFRTGARDWVSVNVPSGLATSDFVGVIAAATGTALPVARARAEACASSSGRRADGAASRAASAGPSARAVVAAPARDNALSAAASAVLSILLRRVGLTVGYPQV